MKVGELIEKLKAFNSDLPVGMLIYNMSFEPVQEPFIDYPQTGSSRFPSDEKFEAVILHDNREGDI